MLESKVLKFMVKISSTVEVNSVYKLGFPELCSWFLQIPWLWWLDQDVTFSMYEQRVGECEAAGGARTCLRLWFTAWTLWISCFWLDESWCSKWKNLRILQSCSWIMRRWCERNKSTQLNYQLLLINNYCYLSEKVRSSTMKKPFIGCLERNCGTPWPGMYCDYIDVCNSRS